MKFFDILCNKPSRWSQKFAFGVTKLMPPDEIRRFDGKYYTNPYESQSCVDWLEIKKLSTDFPSRSIKNKSSCSVGLYCLPFYLFSVLWFAKTRKKILSGVNRSISIIFLASFNPSSIESNDLKKHVGPLLTEISSVLCLFHVLIDSFSVFGNDFLYHKQT